MLLPENNKKLTEVALDIKETCMVSKAQRQTMYTALNRWVEQGQGSGDKSLCNLLYGHVDRLASHLFSPSELRFNVDFDMQYDKTILAQGDVAGRLLSRRWEEKDIDLDYAMGVAISVLYGAAIQKQMWGRTGLTSRLLLPWQFGVYREDLNSITEQEAVCEVSNMTLHEAYRRISHLPDSDKLFNRIKGQSTSGSDMEMQSPSYFHQLLLSSTLNTTGMPGPTRAGGIVDIGPPNVVMVPETTAPMVKYYEMYVNDEEIDDFCTIQLIEPDILIAPRSRRKNLACPHRMPYTLIQPNVIPGYFWGRSEILDLIEPQGLLSDTLYELSRLMAMQFRKLLAFSGCDGITDEKYAQFRGSGFIDMPLGASVNDLTPKIPEFALPYIQLITRMMEQISGFDNILSGQGEPGVRAGVHADTLVRTASPRLRDRSLLVERQCAQAADLSLDLMEEFDPTVYRSNDPKSPTEFTLSLLPEDRRVSVDSHSSSPIYEQDHKDLIGFGVKSGFIDGESAIDLLPLPMKDRLKMRYREAQAAKAEMIKEHPEMLEGKKGKHL